MTRLLVLALAAICLTACQGPAPEPARTVADVDDCLGKSQPTVVRYRSRDSLGLEHAVHLLNRGDDGVRANGCDTPLPLASIVTLRYRVNGS